MNPIINRQLNISPALHSPTGKGHQTNVSMPKFCVITEELIVMKEWRKKTLKCCFVNTLEEERKEEYPEGEH